MAQTGIPILDWLFSALATHGYLAVLVAGALENLFVIGGFMPGETVVMAVAFLASKPDAGLDIYLVWVASVVGTVIGNNLSYTIGRVGGRPLLDRILSRVKRMENTLDQAEEYFEIHGPKTVLISRATAGFKNFVPALAGVSHMRIPIFELYTLIGAILYSTVLCVIGYKFGEYLGQILEWADTAGVWATVAVVAAIAGYVGYRVWRSRRISAQIADHVAEETAEESECGSCEPEGGASGDDD